MVPRYPFIVIIHYKAETRKQIVTRQFDTLAAAFAMRQENSGKRDVHKIVMGIEIDVISSGE